MAIIQCDIRLGRSEAQKRAMVSGILDAVCRYTGCTVDETFLVIHEMPGFNFVEGGNHVPDYVPGPNGEDVNGLTQLIERGISPELG